LQEARDGFLEIAIKRYGEVTTSLIRRYDKNHLILGSRLFFTPLSWRNTMPERIGGFEAIGRGARGYWDVISINNYFNETPLERTRKLYDAFQGPILISEFNIGSSMQDQGKNGEAEWEAKSKISAKGYKEQIPLLFNEPYIIGYHWFPYKNKQLPVEGSARPGLMNYKSEPREILINVLKEINFSIEKIHSSQ